MKATLKCRMLNLFLAACVLPAMAAASPVASPVSDLQRAIACEAGTDTLPILRRHGVPINGERHVLDGAVVIYGVKAEAVFVTEDRNDLSLYVEIPMRQKKAFAKAAGMQHLQDDETSVYTKTLPSGAVLAIDDISDEGDTAVLECRI
ncbi:MAG: hypothetical protein QM612_11705 [Thermomonas sp.]|uniref:hypothetical protein n=1 Tax=Thermomonas sp. TaxID=1971895 RepID=UPI0039E449ED